MSLKFHGKANYHIIDSLTHGPNKGAVSESLETKEEIQNHLKS